MPKYHVSLLIVMLISVMAVSVAVGAEWTYQAMTGISATCIEYDLYHERLLVGTIEGFHHCQVMTADWHEHDEEGWIGRTVYAAIGHQLVDQRVITGRVNAFFKGYIEYSDTLDENGNYVYGADGGEVNGLVRHPLDPDLYYGCTWSDVIPGEIVRSADGGVTWTRMNNTIQYGFTGIAVDHDGVVYASGTDRVTRSFDGGETWELASNGLPAQYGVYCLAANPEIAGELLASNDLGLYRSNDGGDTWSQILPVSCREITWGFGWAIIPDAPRGERSGTPPIGLATWADEVVVSYDDGVNWSDETGQLPGVPIDLTFSLADWNLYVATASSGVYSSPFNSPDAVEETFERPALAMSCPAPFRSGSSITYNLTQPGWTVIELIDPTGRCLQRLVDRWQSAGTHDVRLSAERLPAGVYFSRLTSSNSTVKRKLIVTGR